MFKKKKKKVVQKARVSCKRKRFPRADGSQSLFAKRRLLGPLEGFLKMKSSFLFDDYNNTDVQAVLREGWDWPRILFSSVESWTQTCMSMFFCI